MTRLYSLEMIQEQEAILCINVRKNNSLDIKKIKVAFLLSLKLARCMN